MTEERRSRRIGRKVFTKMLNERFPSVFARVHQLDRGILTFVVEALADATREAIESERFDVVSQHFHFVEEVLQYADSTVRGALGASYIEHLGLSGSDAIHMKARTMLLPLQLALYKEVEEGWRQTGEWLKQTRGRNR